MRTLYRLFKSVKLAVGSILILAVLCLLSTLIPQGLDPAHYLNRYPQPLGRLIVALGFHDFFRSPGFSIPCLLFAVNLSVCAASRCFGRLRRGLRLRLGPDLIHAGLLVVIAGALVSARLRWERTFFLAPGDPPAELPGGCTLRLLDYRQDRYPDGRPKEWVSIVSVQARGGTLIGSYPIRVNHPLRLPRLKIHQTSIQREDTALLLGPDGGLSAIHRGQYFEWRGAILVFAGIENGEAVFERRQGRARPAVHRLSVSQRIGAYRLVGLSSRELSGLTAVRDPGFIPAAAGLALVAAGLGLAFVQKKGDDRP